MLDTIIVIAIVAMAAFFVGRRLFRQFRSTETTCSCTGCGQSGSCSGTQKRPDSKKKCCSQ